MVLSGHSRNALEMVPRVGCLGAVGTFQALLPPPSLPVSLCLGGSEDEAQRNTAA